MGLRENTVDRWKWVVRCGGPPLGADKIIDIAMMAVTGDVEDSKMKIISCGSP